MTSSALRDAIETLDRASSTPELVAATRALCNLDDPEAAETLVKVLGFNNPAVASVATQGLIQLGRDVVPTLLVSMDARNYGARAWVVKALAALRDPRDSTSLNMPLKPTSHQACGDQQPVAWQSWSVTPHLRITN